MSYQRLSYVTMVCVAVHFPMILSLMNGFQIRVSITLKDNRKNKGFFLGFLFKPLGGLRPPRGLNEKASEKTSFIYYL